MIRGLLEHWGGGIETSSSSCETINEYVNIILIIAIFVVKQAVSTPRPPCSGSLHDKDFCNRSREMHNSCKSIYNFFVFNELYFD